MEIFDMIVENDELIAMAVGAVIGAILVAYTCYVVSKVRHDADIRDEYNAAKLAGEEYPSWRIDKSNGWYKGYKLALVILLFGSAVIGVLASILVMKYGYADGIIESCSAAFFGAVIGGLIVDKKIIHPIADNEFLERCETPIVDAFLNPAPEAADDPAADIDPSLIAVAKQLRDKGII